MIFPISWPLILNFCPPVIMCSTPLLPPTLWSYPTRGHSQSQFHYLLSFQLMYSRTLADFHLHWHLFLLTWPPVFLSLKPLLSSLHCLSSLDFMAYSNFHLLVYSMTLIPWYSPPLPKSKHHKFNFLPVVHLHSFLWQENIIQICQLNLP